MSVAGMIAMRGSRVTIRRGTPTDKAEGDTAIAWADVATGEPMSLQAASVEQLQRTFGRETNAVLVGFCDDSTDVQAGDGIVVEAGEHAGTRWRVQGVRPIGGRYQAVALVPTTETFA